jgi:GTP-binding protein YchF
VKVALVGFRGTGKTSVFNALTGQSADTGFGKKGSNLGRIQVPDARVDALAALYHPKKITYADIQFVDAAGPEESLAGSGLDPSLVAVIREAEALVHVVRGFSSGMHSRGPQPAADLAAFEAELILTDLVQIEKRAERLKKEKRGPELELMEKLRAHLESERALRRLELTEEERQTCAGFAFLSMKPVLVVLNQGEDEVGAEPPADMVEAAKERQVDLLALCATMEAEIQAMEPDDQRAFLADLGLTEPVRARFIRAAYALLDLISFLTAGEDEVRAWTIRRGLTAKQASGKIHSDIERGFIRAEVTAYADFIALGSEAKVREAGKLRLEGKDYVVLDGDIMHVRHSG